MFTIVFMMNLIIMDYRQQGADLRNNLVIMEKNSTGSENDRELTGNALKSDGYPLTRYEE